MGDPTTAKRVALVTGGAGGLGRAVAARLGRDGRSIVIGDANAAAAATTAEDLLRDGIDALAVTVDVSEPDSVERMIAAIDEHFGRLDIVINGAGIMEQIDGKKPLAQDIPLATWHRVVAINLTGPFLVSRAAFPLLKRNRWGRIVNISSRAARTRSRPAAYTASKNGLIGLSGVLAGDFGPFGITVNCIAPSRVPTGLTSDLRRPKGDAAAKVAETPIGRIATPEDVAAAVSYLASEEAGFVNGAVLDLNGGSFLA